jgi:hypothetical protein
VSRARIAMNVIAFQAAWLGGVVGAAVGQSWVGPLAALAAAAAHLTPAAAPGRELGALVAIAALGTAWDTVPAALGLIDYRGGVDALAGLPLWMMGLWLAFATTLNVSLRWLRGHMALAALLGAVGGPLSFAAAARLGAVSFDETAAALAVQGAGWAVLLPVASAIAARLDGVAAVPTERARV